MTAPKNPTLVELGKILGDLVGPLQWIEGARSAVVRAIMQETNAVLGGTTMTEAKACVVAWAVLTELGAYVRDIEPGDEEEPGEAVPETFG
ncbi:hypothetical protein JOF56_011626 [Kibdelosporangium banguiense]|uniref:Uncharacterized protein n=1 Tax=Kibdelosporangium banguiense TaxID=1365924 RepID=A0ABS4U4W7_9PSEU|nr:hypothetical protein [Kibdelosporangium banguiense]MBP2331241.1 hypothetical protein [Kibdelosporangium banguiense]